MTRVLIFYPNLQTGGTESVIRQIAPELEKTYTLYTANLKEDKTLKVLKPSKTLPWTGGAVVRYFRAARSLRQYVESQKIDKVIAFGEVPIFLCFILSYFLPKFSFIACVRNSEKQHFKVNGGWAQKFKFLLFVLALKRSNYVTTNSEALSEEVRGYSKDLNVVCIANPISEKFFKEVNARHVVKPVKLLNVGRLVKQKNQIELLKLMKRLQDKSVNVTLSIYGEGELGNSLRSFVIEEEIHNVDFYPYTASIHAVYQQHDLFVLTSHWEGSPNALAEAMASGMCVVSYDCPTGPRDLIENGYNGYLIGVGDLRNLENTIEQLVASPKLREQLGMCARTSVSGLQIKNILKNWCDLIEM